MQPPVCKPVLHQAVRLGHEFRGQKDLGSSSSATCRLAVGAILPSESPHTRIKKQKYLTGLRIKYENSYQLLTVIIRLDTHGAYMAGSLLRLDLP